MIREIFGKKLGMTQIFDKEGSLIGVTLVEVEPVCILEEINYPTKKRVKIGCFKWPENRLNHVKKPALGYFKKLGVGPFKLIREVAYDKVDATAAENQQMPDLKKEVGVEIFNEGDMVNVRSKTKGRGFAGGIKRHGWHGGPGAHGSMTHRRIGSNGANTDPGRVVRGHRMPGHMGDALRTTQELTIVKIDKEKKLLFIKGSISGARGTVVSVAKA